MSGAITFLLTYSIRVVGSSNYSSMIIYHDTSRHARLHDRDCDKMHILFRHRARYKLLRIIIC